jgi:hypothetical protein
MAKSFKSADVIQRETLEKVSHSGLQDLIEKGVEISKRAEGDLKIQSPSTVPVQREFRPREENSPRDTDTFRNTRPSKSTVTKSFILERTLVEDLLDFVYTMKKNGNVDYTQSDAIKDGLESIFKTVDLLERPDHMRDYEKTLSKAISEGRRKSGNRR